MSRVVFLLVLVAVVAMCTHEASAQRGRPVRPPPGRPGRPGGQGRPGRCSGPGERWDSCGPSCQATCANRRPTGRCLRACQPGCQCINGWIRRSAGGNCIRTNQCPRSG